MLTGISGASDGMKKSQMWHGGKVFQGTVPSVQSSRLLSELKLPVATEAGAFGGAFWFCLARHFCMESVSQA